jgi:hypothetical protein
MKRKTILLTGLFLLISCWLKSQTTIQGYVYNDNKEPLPGALVYIKGKMDGASTDDKGFFKFRTRDTGTVILVGSFISYKKQEVPVKLNKKTTELSLTLEEDISNIEAVTISAGQFEAGDEKKTTILSSLDIYTTAGGDADMYAVMKTLPGTGVGTSQSGLQVRGGAGREAATIIDGIRVAHPFYNDKPDIAQRGRFSPTLFRGTYFSAGGYSAEYGQALSSALVLNTEGLAETTSSNIDLMSIGAGAGHTKRWEKASLGGSVSYMNLSPYYRLAPQNLTWINAPTAFSGTTTYRQILGKNGLIKFYSQGDINSSSLYVTDTSNVMNQVLYKSKDKNLYTNLSYFDKLNEKWNFNVATSLCTNSADVDLTNIALRSHDASGQAKVKFTRNMGDLSNFRIGAEYGRFNYHNEVVNFSGNLHDNYIASFAETDLYLTKNLVMRVGGRIENSSVIDKSNFAPRASMAYKLKSGAQFSLAYGMFYQLPENQYIFQQLKEYEKTSHYIANFQKVTDNQTFRIEAYYKKYNNLTLFDYSKNQYTVAGDGYARGFEFFWRDKKTFTNTDYWLSYSFLDTKRKFLHYTNYIMPDFAAKHTFSAVYKRFVQQINSNIGFTYSYSSGHTYNNPLDNKPLNSLTPAYHNLSFTNAYIKQVNNRFIVVAFSVSNILGFDNILGYRYSNAGQVRVPIKEFAKRFYFLGVFISLNRDNSGDIF